MEIGADFASDPRGLTFNQEWKKAQDAFGFTQKILPNAPKKILARDEQLSIFVNIKPEDLPKIFSIFKAGDNFDVTDDTIDIFNDPLGMEPSIWFLDEAPEGLNANPATLFKKWWKEWGNWGETYMDEKTAKRIERMGINPKRSSIDSPGLNRDYVRDHHTGSSEMEEWEQEYENEVKEPEELEKIEKPRDYQLASPMHQPFESRLARALGLIQT